MCNKTRFVVHSFSFVTQLMLGFVVYMHVFAERDRICGIYLSVLHAVCQTAQIVKHVVQF